MFLREVNLTPFSSRGEFITRSCQLLEEVDSDPSYLDLVFQAFTLVLGKLSLTPFSHLFSPNPGQSNLSPFSAALALRSCPLID